MSLAAALILAASAATAPVPEVGSGMGVQLTSVQARATIVQAVVVRQGSGPQPRHDMPIPQVRRQGAALLVEFQ